MSIFIFSSIYDFFHQGSFFINCSDIQTAEVMGAKLVLNEKMLKNLPFETNLVYVAQTVFKQEQIKENLP